MLVRIRRPLNGALIALWVTLSIAELSADVVLYRVPDTALTFALMGNVKVNPGGTVSIRNPRGTLHFSTRDCRIVRTPNLQQVYGIEKRAAEKAATVDAHLDLALWCVKNGMLAEADRSLAAAWRTNPKDDRVKLMVKLTKYRRGTVPASPSDEIEMRQFVKNNKMKFTRSRHYLMLHDTPDDKDQRTGKTIAETRLQLLEKVYDSFYMKYALEGFPLQIPRTPMRVVLFSDHADYLNFVQLISPALKQTAGFYDAKENIAIFFQQTSAAGFQEVTELSSELSELRATIAKNPRRVEGGGEMIRFAKTLEHLIDIEGENQEIEVVTHEATHQLAANSGLLDRTKFHVRWAHEGLASYFESPKEAAWAGIGSVNQQRIGYYRLLASDPEHSKIEFVVTDKIFDFAGSQFSVQAAYGQAWALTHFLTEQHLPELMEFYRAMAVDDFETVRDEAWRMKTLNVFKNVFGDMDTIELEWKSYMRTLKTDLELLHAKL